MPDARRLPINVSPAALTRRQREIVGLIAVGHTNRDIARMLGLTPATVDNYVQQVRWRLGVKHRTQIAVWAVRQGLDPRPDEPDWS